jgi:histidine ammonia-lyase
MAAVLNGLGAVRLGGHVMPAVDGLAAAGLAPLALGP